MKTLDREDVLNRACIVLADALPEAWVIYAYGSFARGDERADSDLDLAVLLPPKAVIPDKLALTAGLAQAAGREVDIIDLRAAGLDLVHEILRDGRALLLRCPEGALEWEAERMTDYALFNPRRADILARYLNEPLHTT